jgi:hypothetical protein
MERAAPVAGSPHVVACFFEQAAKRHADVMIVLDE